MRQEELVQQDGVADISSVNAQGRPMHQQLAHFMMAKHLISLLWLKEMYSNDDHDEDYQSKGSYDHGAEKVSC